MLTRYVFFLFNFQLLTKIILIDYLFIFSRFWGMNWNGIRWVACCWLWYCYLWYRCTRIGREKCTGPSWRFPRASSFENNTDIYAKTKCATVAIPIFHTFFFIAKKFLKKNFFFEIWDFFAFFKYFAFILLFFKFFDFFFIFSYYLSE